MDEVSFKSPLLETQGFAGGGLVRGLTTTDDCVRMIRDPGCRIVLVAGRQIGCYKDDYSSHYAVCWFDNARLRELGFEQILADADAWGYEYRVGDDGPTTSTRCPLYYLGKEEDGMYYMALDVTEVLAFLGHPIDHFANMMDLRHLFTYLPPLELARAGHAVALSQWHQSHRYCPKCGSLAIPIAAGTKRQCTRQDAHKQYPRTDPVIIVLVTSPGRGDYALLGRSLKLPTGMLTCLSGFIDVGESIEEAVVREVAEEAGVQVSMTSVRVVGSQPWPLGRGGSHELMIGCIAQAISMELSIDHTEMAECRWVTRAELQDAVMKAANLSSNTHHYGRLSKQGGTATEGKGEDYFFIPPPTAIAHHLIKTFVAQKSQNTTEEESP